MALNPKYRAKDKDLVFSAAQSLTVTTQAYSTSEIDWGSLASTDIAAGSNVDIVVQVTAISATAASTMIVTVVAGTATAPTTVALTLPTVTGSAAFEKIFSVPKDLARFVRLGYLLTGSAASTATISAHATARP